MAISPISGHVVPGFESVREAFQDNFDRREEIGAALAVWYRDELVVDLWGGSRIPGKSAPWQADTVALVFSVTKGMAALAVALLHARGLLNFDKAVAHYWPEFAQAGKAEITVRQLLAHQAGLAALDERLDPDRIADFEWMSDTLARQAPAWAPGTRHGYHAFTLGSYISQLVSRIDPQRRKLPQFFAEEIAGPLGVDFFIGLPRDISEARVADMQGFSKLKLLTRVHELPWRMLTGLMWPWSLASRALLNPNVSNPVDYNTPAFRHLDFASGVGFGTARSLARVYGDVVSGSSQLGFDHRTLSEIAGDPSPPLDHRRDLVMGAQTSWHLGFARSCALYTYPTPRCFGMRGASGADGFGDPDAPLGFGYINNRCSLNAFREPRVQTLIDSVYASLS